MSKSIIAKVAAVACSVATLSALGIAASAQKNTEIADRTDIVADKTNIVAGIVQAEAGEKVLFPVYIANNAAKGFAATGVRLIHDDRLTVTLDEDEKPITKKGDAGNDVTCTFSYNKEKKIVGLGTMGTDPEKDNGVMYTVEVVVPSDAKNGDKYPMTIEIDKWLDAKTNPVDHVAVNGYIIVGEPPVETTATASETTTSTTVTTTSTAPTTSSTAPTTSSTAPTTTSDSVTTSSTQSTSGTTTTGKGAVVVTTTAKSGSTSSTTTATKTGDAGVGVAVAGLLLAAGTAVVATKKKKD